MIAGVKQLMKLILSGLVGEEMVGEMVGEAGVSDMSDILKCDFGGPIEEKVSGLEGCHVANPDV